MELSQEALLPVLLVTTVANIAIVAALLASGRIGRRRGVATSGRQSFDDAILPSSDRDGSALPAEPATNPPITTPSADEEADLEADAVTTAPKPFILDPSGTETDVAADAEPELEPAVADLIAGGAAGGAAGVTADEGVDPLTRLPDAAAFARLVADEDARIARYHHPATIVVFELDGFDRLVERLGRDAGDRVLPAVADTIRRLGRSADHVGRIGPSRFATLLPETDEVAAINYLERVRRACEIWLESGAIALRLAIGWAGTSGEPTLVEAQRIATSRMYSELRRGSRSVDPEAEETAAVETTGRIAS
jgi:diguanylate cyclase (GGDEF)-like protein